MRCGMPSTIRGVSRIKKMPAPMGGRQKDPMTMKVVALSRAARKTVRDKTNQRGVYRKKASRNRDVPPAWEIGDAASFAKAKSIAMERICLDPKLGGKAKAILANCLKRMNCHEQWSCFVSIERLAQDAQTHEATCWRAIHDADGTYIATRTGWRSRAAMASRVVATVLASYWRMFQMNSAIHDALCQFGLGLIRRGASLRSIQARPLSTVDQRFQTSALLAESCPPFANDVSIAG